MWSLFCFTMLLVISKTAPCCYAMPENKLLLLFLMCACECLFLLYIWLAKRIGLLLWNLILTHTVQLFMPTYNKKVDKKILDKYSNL